MADWSEDIFDTLFLEYSGDTGSGGLAEAGGTAYVPLFVRLGDPNISPEHMHQWPMIVVEIHNAESRIFGARRTESIVRMHLYTHRDTNTSSFTQQNAVADRINGLFDGATLADQGLTKYAILNQLRDFQGPTSNVELHRIFEFSLHPILSTGV